MPNWVKKNVSRPLRKRFKKRYIGKKSGALRVGQIAKDVMYLKSVLNPEKKFDEIYYNNQNVAANNGVPTGMLVLDVTPVISQGVTQNDRTGNSIKVCSSVLRAQVKQQANTTGPLRLKAWLIQGTGGTEPTTSNISTQFLQTNPFSNVVDYFSQRNVNYFNDYKVLASKSITLRPDQYSGQFQIQELLLARKYKSMHFKYTQTGTGIVQGTMFLVVVADWGDIAASTGAYLDLYNRVYYYDN